MKLEKKNEMWNSKKKTHFRKEKKKNVMIAYKNENEKKIGNIK